MLNCRGAPKKPPQQLEWKLNTGRTEAWKVLSPEGGSWDSVARVLPNGSLLLPAVGIQDEGTFRCQATSRNGKEMRSAYQVRVYRKSSRAFSKAHLSSKEKLSTPPLIPCPGVGEPVTSAALDPTPTCESLKLQPLTEIFPPSEIPGKPEIVSPASELMPGVPNKVGTCVSEGGYPAGTLNWHSDGKLLIPDGKGVSVLEETTRQPQTGLFTLQSALMVTPAWGGAPHLTFSCSFSPGLPRRRALHTASIQLRVWGE